MSKNISRKGIAFGVAATVGFAGLTGALPAQAAELVTLSPLAGTSYNVPLDETFTLKTYFAAAAQNAASDELKVRVVDADGVLGEASGVDIQAHPGTYLDETEHELAYGDSTFSFVDGVGILAIDDVAGSASKDFIELIPNATETSSVTVQTWVDSDGNDVIDADEAKSGIRTINFLDSSDIKATVSITDATDFHATESEAKIVFSPALNLDLFADAEKVLSLGDLDVNFPGNNPSTLVLNSDGSVKATNAATTEAGNFTVEALLDTDVLGKATKVIADHEVADSVADALVAVKNNNVTVDGLVRTGTKNVDTVLSVENTAGESVGAGVLVRVSASSNLLDPDAAGVKPIEAIKVNGKSIVVDETLTFNVFTDANGQVKLPVSASAGYEGTSVEISASAEGVTIDSLELAWENAEYLTITPTDKSGSHERSITEGGSTSLTFEVKDQFGLAIGSGARLHFTVEGNDSELVDSWVTLVGGKAAVKVADTTADESTSYEIDGELEVQATNGNYEAQDVLISDDEYYYVNVAEAATKFDLNVEDEFEVIVANADVAVESVPSESAPSTVSVNNPGAPITISSKGVTFTINEVEYADTVTVFSDSNGDVAFKASSKVAGEHTIAFTAGADSGSTIFKVNPAAPDSGVKLTLSAPAKVAPGGVLAVVGTLTDKYGNPVFTDAEDLVSFTYKDSGLGIAIAGNSVANTDENGKFTLRYSIAANQSGTAVVTVKYDADLSTESTNKILSASKTVYINKASTASASAGSKKATVVVKNSIGETVKVYVDGVLKSTKVATSNNYSIVVSRLTAGKHTVKVVVSGRSVLNTRVVVKK